MMEQGTQEWLDARVGKITASRVGDILTPAKKKGDISATAMGYMVELIAEKLTGVSRELEGEALTWGSEHEAQARELYEAYTLSTVTEVGFIDHPTAENVGGSPDGLVGDKGLIEIKCPYNTVYHVGYLLGDSIPKKYIAQMQANMWITGREWCDFISFDPRIQDPNTQLHIRRVVRDEDYIANMEKKISEFLEKLRQKLGELKA